MGPHRYNFLEGGTSTLVPELQKLRIEGIYEQRQPGHFMLRVKIPAGVLSSEQALKIAEIADSFARGTIHLTTRTSVELHWLTADNLAQVGRMLAAVGLTSRGACGGAVRGVVCSTAFSPEFPRLQVLARKLHRHFTGNPRCEGLPKKFKIGVDGSCTQGRHLIQDIGLVHAGTEMGLDRYDVWVAGGLGREPQPAFLLERRVPERQLIGLIEAVILVYRGYTPPGKRLKHLVREIGKDRFLALLEEHRSADPVAPLPDGFDASLTPHSPATPDLRLEAGVFAGDLPASVLRRLAAIAAAHAGGFMVLTCDQNVAFHLVEAADRPHAALLLAEAGLSGTTRDEQVLFRICPGNHECRLGLSTTRDIARDVLAAMGDAGNRLAWSIAGCPNSCSQPQLADIGIVTTKLDNSDERRLPRFDLYRRDRNDGFGEATARNLTIVELLEAVRKVL